MTTLTIAERRELRARAHALDPVVAIAGEGLSEAVLREIDRSLAAHELIKVRVFDTDRAAREALFAQVCQALDAAPVQHIGKVLVVWRKRPEAEEDKAGQAARPPRPNSGARKMTKKAAAEFTARQATREPRTKRAGATGKPGTSSPARRRPRTAG